MTKSRTFVTKLVQDNAQLLCFKCYLISKKCFYTCYLIEFTVWVVFHWCVYQTWPLRKPLFLVGQCGLLSAHCSMLFTWSWSKRKWRMKTRWIFPCFLVCLDKIFKSKSLLCCCVFHVNEEWLISILFMQQERNVIELNIYCNYISWWQINCQ